MRRILTFLLAILLVFALMGCSTSGEIQEPSNVSTTPSKDATEQTKSPTEAPTEAPTEEVIENTDTTIMETVLIDEAGVKITAKSFETDALFGPEIKVLIENNSGKDLTIQTQNTSVNGFMVETLMSVDVVDGKKANDSVTFMSSELEACGIETIAQIELSFHIFTTEDWESYLDTDPITITTSAADSYVDTYDASGFTAYEGNDIKIVVKGLSEDDSIFGPGIVVYIENNSAKNITVQTRDVSINGFMLDPLFSSDIVAGKRAVDAITFFSSDLEENEITQIETVELSFLIFNFEDWETIEETDTITISF